MILIDCVKSSQTAEEKRHSILHNKWVVLAIKIVSLAVALYVLFGVIFGIHVNTGNAMAPKILDGDIALFYRLDKDYHVGDCVVYRYNTSCFVGRICGRENDRISVSDEQQLYINGSPQSEEIYYPTTTETLKDTLPLTVPPASFYLLNDYRLDETDSRTMGVIPENQIMGKIVNVFRNRGI